ncbi:hypothetical protein AMECASPLE_002399 [Ameca splendens]|uniref:Uncharacterized protein n=1 Tax=Ameca splendens TaxID=208324 RepID=A0ABV1A4J1_9TELE
MWYRSIKAHKAVFPVKVRRWEESNCRDIKPKRTGLFFHFLLTSAAEETKRVLLLKVWSLRLLAEEDEPETVHKDESLKSSRMSTMLERS